MEPAINTIITDVVVTFVRNIRARLTLKDIQNDQMAEWPNARTCKVRKPPVQIRLWSLWKRVKLDQMSSLDELRDRYIEAKAIVEANEIESGGYDLYVYAHEEDRQALKVATLAYATAVKEFRAATERLYSRMDKTGSS